MTEKMSPREDDLPKAISTIVSTPVEAKPQAPQTGVPIGLVAALAGISLTIFIGALDMNIIATAVPSITDEFHSSADSGWYGSAYLLSVSSLQLSWGRLYKIFPAKWTFLSALTVFEVGSLLCGTAPSSTVFIVGRAIAGMGIAGVFSGAMIIASYTIPLRFRPLVNSGLAVLMGSTRALAPIIGGALTSTVGWRWCFYLNLPCGGLCGVLVALGTGIQEAKEESPETWIIRLRSFDWIGLVCWAPFTICLLLIIQFGGVQYPWSSPQLIVLYILAILTLLLFTYSQIYLGEGATVPPRIITQRSMIWGSIFEFLIGGASQMLQYFLPIFFQVVQGKSALGSGTAILPLLISYTLSLTLTGVAISVVGKYAPFMHIGSAIAAVGMALLSTMTVHSSLGQSIGFQILCGVGVGLALDGPQLAAQTVFNQTDVPVALTVVTTLMNLGGAVFVSVGSSIFNNRAATLLKSSAPGLSEALAAGTGLTELVKSLPVGKQDEVIKSLQTILSNIFQCGIAIVVLSFFVSLGVEWRSVRSKSPLDVSDKEHSVIAESGDSETK
ncbi:major facilitator superfamily transporter [Penicillium longicatenatum]|nr:major facilitator superfamily transporter [Penicillium longicatenatum]